MAFEANKERRALVLGGGGVTGIAWMTGLLLGLAELGIDLTTADLMIGTSAGSVVGAQLTSGMPLIDLYARQLADASGEIAARMRFLDLLRFVAMSALPGDPQQARARLGHAALRARTVSAEQRRAVIAGRLPYHGWPDRPLRIVAVDAANGAEMIFDRTSGVDLIDAVGASCAVPLVWPPVTIAGRQYVDGGVRSVANVDLAKGYDRVVVLAPITVAPRRADRPAEQLAALNGRGLLLSPNSSARAAIGGNMLDPAHRAPAARAGYAQAATEAERARAIWT